jgi:hypothetical protein
MPSAAETRLSWAVRAWDAEVENASRLANRANLVLTIALAFTGFGMKELGDALRTHPSDSLSWVVLTGAGLGLGTIFWAFIVVLAKRQDPKALRSNFASWEMLPPGDLVNVTADVEMLDRASRSATAAAYELHGRNTSERERLKLAQQFLIVGAVLTLVCGGIYTVSREAPGGSTEKCCCCGSPAPAGE